MRVNVLKSSGFCGGVTRALYLLDKAIKENKDRTIYLLGDIVHNDTVNEKYKKLSVKVISKDELDSLKDGEIVLSSAHGISDKMREKLSRFNHIDTTCPFVRKNQNRIKSDPQKEIIFIGKKKHAETVAMTEDNENIWIIESEDELNFFNSFNEGSV